MKLYFTPRLHFSRKVRILLDAWKVEVELLDVGNVGRSSGDAFGPISSDEGANRGRRQLVSHGFGPHRSVPGAPLRSSGCLRSPDRRRSAAQRPRNHEWGHGCRGRGHPRSSRRHGHQRAQPFRQDSRIDQTRAGLAGRPGGVVPRRSVVRWFPPDLPVGSPGAVRRGRAPSSEAARRGCSNVTSALRGIQPPAVKQAPPFRGIPASVVAELYTIKYMAVSTAAGER